MALLLHHLLAGVPYAQVFGPLDRPISGVAYDSRQVVPGGLFVAIKGYHTDGHRYISQALERGAVALVVDRRYWSGQPPAQATLVLTNDSRVALAPLAAAFYGYPARQLCTIGVTGTKGKSTTTDLVSQLLDGAGQTSGLISTVDFKIGPRRWANTTRQSTPEALEVQALLAEMVAATCTSAVIEATSHALSLKWQRLVGCCFDLAVFLNLSHEHLDYHGSFEQYRADKTQLFALLAEEVPAGPPRSTRPWAIVNADDPNHSFFLAAAPANAQRLTFGLQASADVRGELMQQTPTGSHMRISSPWGRAEGWLPLPGRFNGTNALAALSVALCQGIPLEQALHTLAHVRGPRGRMQPVVCGQPFAVLVDYAHSPDSFTQIFTMLRPLTQGRMLAVFGSAGERDRAKRAMQGEIAARYCELLFLTDEDPRGEDREAILADIAAGAEQVGHRAGRDYHAIPDRTAAIHAALAAARPGDLVLLLGKGHEGSIIYADHSIPWDEAAVAQAALRALGYGER
ncbi:UDP-N-acetylmuramoyl-L-alanyl-D-glutamate--2,6-diaminopimelate ligase [Candidatus Viridilinea mediisalina]|uniref:UDP-N-acetylmuramyl-tripeptide synthetase n=1 Tax=Candidatus Viridilinea mediisalina TaxID=2024553 RepID=A0A2A6RKG5_9CHLR|nr:UDP-N-acetylmuramoyl-L-alanyl-D-glutamate--2,6-diaminopimelate ligase [Candidatus Viridilinea mediisalina]PDW03379.1 UDP-N-acetylmuramoyl-L-alanyl-D-glutamate--2,6-diaminopimelate ligase [Candidatus Viridilinea mediisalina]